MRRFHSNRSLTAKFSKMFQLQFLILLLLYTCLGINFNTLVCTVLRKGDKMTIKTVELNLPQQVHFSVNFITYAFFRF